MIIDSPIVSGSQLASGPFTQIGNVQITGSLSVTGPINGTITGSITSASYATSAEFLDGLDSTSFVFTSSFNTFSGSAAGRITSLEAFSSSLDATFATDASVTASILVLSQSVQASQAALSSSYTITSGSYASASGSLSIRTSNLEATASTLTSASASFAAQSASLSTRLTTDESNFNTTSGSLSTRVTNLESTSSTVSSSFATTSGSLSTRVTNLESTSSTVSSSFASTSGSISSRVTLIEGQYATTGSNTFTNLQYISATTNAQGFTTTASLYTDGGLRVSKDSYVSGTAYFNNVVVYGTSSIQYLTSSQVNVGANIINLNTQTPAVRFGGMAVADSGSNAGVTGSMLWDSVYNRWIYSNPSGSTYDGGMLISGPRNTTGLGNELGTTACALMMGQGGDHITSSAIFSYDNATCFYATSFISSSGAACFAGTITAGGDITSRTSLNAYTLSNIEPYVFLARNSGTNGVGVIRTLDGGALAFDNGATGAAQSTKLSIAAGGVACFSNTICAPAFVGGVVSGTALCISNGIVGNNSNNLYLSTNSAAGEISFWGNQLNTRLMTLTGCGNLGVGTNSPDIATGYRSVIANGINGSIYRTQVNGTTAFDIQADPTITYLWGYGNYPIAIGTCATERLRLAANGIACFTCQICVPNIISTGVSGGRYATFGAPSNGGYMTFEAGGTPFGDLGSYCAQYGTCNATTLLLSTRTGYDLALGSSSTERLRFYSTGIACFSCQVCLREAVYICGSFPRVVLDRSSTTAQSDIKFVDAGTSVWSIGTAVQAVGSNLDFYNYTLGGNVLKLTTTGEACFKCRVGIGAAAHSTRKLRVSQDVGDEWIAEFIHTGTNPYGVYIDTSANASTVSAFQIYANTGGGLKFTNDSKLGIGTYNSSYGKLQVNGIVDSFDNQAVFRVWNAAASFAGGSGTDAWAFAGSNTDYAVYGPNDLYLYSGGQRRLQFTGGGVACFRCQVCAPSIITTGTNSSVRGGDSAFFRGSVVTQSGNSITFDAFRFLNPTGGVTGAASSIAGRLFMSFQDTSTGGNQASYEYLIFTTGNGVTPGPYSFTQASCGPVRGTNPISAISLVNDGAGGAVKVQATTAASGVAGAVAYITFVGTAV